MIRKGALETGRIQILVLDEVDVMLSRGFEQQVGYKSSKTNLSFSLPYIGQGYLHGT